MNITVISQHFTYGGLETQLFGYARCLVERGHQVSFVVGRRSKTSHLKKLVGKRILAVDFWPPVSGWKALAAIDRIARFCGEMKTDLLHLHPFLTLTTGALAAAHLSLPYVITLHGLSNLDPLSNFGYSRDLDRLVYGGAARIFCVGRNLVEILQSRYPSARPVFLPNGVNVEQFSPAQVKPDGDWAIISRMGGGKSLSIRHALEKLFLLPNRNFRVRLFGDGSERRALKKWVKQQPFRHRVRFEGMCLTIPQELRKGYAGCAGMARSFLEGAAMGFPMVLVNEEGVKGLVRPEQMPDLQLHNFSGRNLPTISDRELLDQMASLVANPASYCLRPWVVENANEELIWEKYLTHLESLVPGDYSSLLDKIRALEQHPSESIFSEYL